MPQKTFGDIYIGAGNGLVHLSSKPLFKSMTQIYIFLN